MKTIISGGTAYVEGAFVKADILIEDDIILKVSKNLQEEADRVIDAKGKHIFPGFVDLHAHLRDPGQTYKEDIVTGTKAAAKGGYTTICAMPNTDPVTDNIAAVEYIHRRSKDLGYCKVRVIGAMTKKSAGLEISEMATMKSGGIIAVSDDGYCVQNARLMMNCMKYAVNYNLPIIVHAEDYNLAGKGQIHAGKISSQLGLSGIPALAEEVIIARDIMLAESTKARLHIAHVSSCGALDIIRNAMERGVRVSCEVTPHHLLLNEDAVSSFNTNMKMKPPLRSEKDRKALIAALKDGLISCIATDHAPHADYEKEREFDYAPFGVIGFETAFAVLYHNLVLTGELSLERLIDALSIAPAKTLDLPAAGIFEGNKSDLVIADLDDTIMFDADSLLSKSKNSPWINTECKGKILYTICEGNITYQAQN